MSRWSHVSVAVPAEPKWVSDPSRPKDGGCRSSALTTQNLIGYLGTSRIRIGTWGSKAIEYARNFGSETNPRRGPEFEMRRPRRNTGTWDRQSTLAKKYTNRGAESKSLGYPTMFITKHLPHVG